MRHFHTLAGAWRAVGLAAGAAALAFLTPSVRAGYTTSLGVENQFRQPAGWSVGDAGLTFQQWDAKSAAAGNLPDRGFVTNPAGLANPTHGVTAPGFRTGSSNYYSFSGDFGVLADVFNHGGPTNGYGTHVIVQTGSSVNHAPDAWAEGTTELVADHGVGAYWQSLRLVDHGGAAIPGGDNPSALWIGETSYFNNVSTAMGPVDYQELIFEFWLPGYTGDFRVAWNQVVHTTADTLRVDSKIALAAPGGGSPFPLTAVPEPATAALGGSAILVAVGMWALRRRREGAHVA